MADHQLYPSQRTITHSGKRMEKAQKKRSYHFGGSRYGVLPMSEDNEVFMREISNEILQNGGEAYLMKMAPHEEGTSKRIIAAFNQARNKEYEELLEQCDDLLRELDKESLAAENAPLQSLRKMKEFQKLTAWYQKITERDFNGASLRPSAHEKIEQCRSRLEVFSQEVYRQNDEIPE